MRLKELKNEWPETPEFIHNMIQTEVGKQVTNVIPLQESCKYRWKMGRIAASVAVCIIASSTVAYAGVKLYHIYLEKQEKYSVKIGIQANQETNSLEIPKKIHDISINSTYIPECMEWTEKDCKLGYKDSLHQGGISIFSVLMDGDDLDKVLLDKNIVESEEHMFGCYEGVYLKYNDLKEDESFNQRIYMLCPQNYRILTMYIGDDVSKEDAYKFAEGLVIDEKEEMIVTSGMETWSDMIANEEVIEETELAQTVTNADIPIFQVGEAFQLRIKGNDVYSSGITVCVDDVQIADNLSLLKEEYIPKEWKMAIDVDGELVQNHLSYVKAGDGIDSLDQIVDEKNVSQKLVYVTVTYTNSTNQEMNHVLYLGSLLTLERQEDGTHTVYLAEETGGNGYDYYVGDSVAGISEMKYYDVKEEYGNGGNYISSLKPGESIQVHMAWVVNKTDIQNLYLDLSGFGTLFEIHENVVNTGLVHIGR